jgi:hypothetical protein
MPDTQEIEAGQVPARDSEKKLTPKQERFVQEYLIDFNATQAAIRAGYSKNTAQEIGSQNLSKLMIQAKIRQKQAKIAEKFEITEDLIATELARNAFLDHPRRAFDAESQHRVTALKELAKFLGLGKENNVDRDNKGNAGVDLDAVRRFVREVRK